MQLYDRLKGWTLTVGTPRKFSVQTSHFRRIQRLDSETSESNFSASRNLTNCLVSISRKARRQRMDS